MPYTSMPAWPNLSDQEVSDLAYFITTFSPDFSNPENVPQPVPLPSAPTATKESIELGKKLYEETGCVKCHGTLGRGDGPSAPTLMDDWGHPIRPADLAQSWTFRGGSSREDIFRTMSTGFNGTPMPSFLDALKPEQRWAITDFIVSLSGSSGPGYTNLVVAKHVQDPIDLAKGAASFAVRSGRPLSDRRADHGARTRVPSSRDLRDRSGHLRCRVDRPPRSMARHERAEDGEERAVASRAAGGGGGAADRRPASAGRRGEERLRRRGSRRGRQRRPGAAPQDPFAERQRRQPASHPSSPTRSRSRFLRRCRRAPASPTSSSATPRTRWISGSSIWPAPIPLQFTGKGSADIAPNDTGDLTGVASYDQGEWSVIFKRPLRATRAPRSRPESSCRSPSRSGTGSRASVATGEVSRSGTPSTSSQKSVPSAVGPMVQDGAAHSRHRAGRDRLGAVALRLSRPRGARR